LLLFYIWAEYGVTAPIWAHVYDSTLIYAKSNEASVSLRGSVASRIEPEIAFKLRAAVPTNCKDPAVTLASIEWLAPSFEIVGLSFCELKIQARRFGGRLLISLARDRWRTVSS
jgi:2-keto-4-pentenoate hydratase